MLERYQLSVEDTHEIEEFLRDLYRHYGFSSVINSQRNRDSFYAWSRDRKDDVIDDYLDCDFDICSGAARMVILYKDWAIKIPFEYNEAIASRHGNFCEEELLNYESARKEGMEDFFAPCVKCERVYFDKHVTCPVYVMPRLYVNESFADSIAENSNSKLFDNDEYSGSSDCMNVIEIMASWWSDEDIEKLIEFCDSHRINDLHYENFGFNKDTDQPFLIDYAGF